MIPRSKAIDWDDVEVGDRMHLIPYSVLSDDKALAVEVIYVRNADHNGMFHGDFRYDPPPVFVTVRCGQGPKERRQTFWHELAHVLDLSEIDPSNGYRAARRSPRFSARGGTLEPLLEHYLDVINMDPKQFAGFDDFNPPKILPYSSYAAGADDPVELFARAVVLSVLYPVEAKRVMPDLHEKIAAILCRELCLKIPKKTVARFHWRLINGNWRKFPVVNGVEIGTKRKASQKKANS
jgi:hypothetical protein